MALPTMPFTRLCDENCCSAHNDHTRDHLPVVLMRATHNGSGSIPPNHGPDSDGNIWPRYRGRREIEGWEVDCHGEMQSYRPTQFSSFTTWMGLSSRIRAWKTKGVRNIRVHVILTHLLPSHSEVYTVTALRKHFKLKQQPYFKEEYLIRGPISSDAIVSSYSGDGEDVLLPIPLFGFRCAFPPIDLKECLVTLPAGFLLGASETNMELVTRRLARECGSDIPRRVILDAFTRGHFFTVADLWRIT
jgi:hypothetical protein